MSEVQWAAPLLPRVEVTGNLWQKGCLSAAGFAGSTVGLVGCAGTWSRVRGHCWRAAAGAGRRDPPAAAQRHSSPFSTLLLKMDPTGMSATMLVCLLFRVFFPGSIIGKIVDAWQPGPALPLTGCCGEHGCSPRATLKRCCCFIVFLRLRTLFQKLKGPVCSCLPLPHPRDDETISAFGRSCPIGDGCVREPRAVWLGSGTPVVSPSVHRVCWGCVPVGDVLSPLSFSSTCTPCDCRERASPVLVDNEKESTQGICSPVGSLTLPHAPQSCLESSQTLWGEHRAKSWSVAAVVQAASQSEWASTRWTCFPRAVCADGPPWWSAHGYTQDHCRSLRAAPLCWWLIDWRQSSAIRCPFHVKRECSITHKGGYSLPMFWSGFELDNVLILRSVMSVCWRLSGSLLKFAYLKFCHLAVV